MARRLILLVVLAALVPGAASAEAKQLTRYGVGGGIAGRFDELTVATDGKAHQTGDSGEHRWTVSAKKLRGLKRALKAAKFSTLKRSYKPKAIVFDGISRSIRYRGKTVTVSTGARIPDRLGEVLRRLSRIMKS